MRTLGIVLLLSSAVFLNGCGPKELTPEQKAYVGKLEAELSQTKADMELAKQADAAYSGGLIKSLISIRLEILKTNQALIEQRILALQSGAPVKIETIASNPDETLATSVASEIQTIKASIEGSKRDAAQYSGGLIQVMKLSAIATSEQTLAMLQQRYLIAKYGLSPAGTSPVAGVAPAPSTPAPTPPPTQLAAQLLPPGAGPFGLEAGISKEMIEKMTGEQLQLVKDSENLYSADKVPKQNDAFEQYGLVISPTVGLCVIRAVGKTVQTNDYGHQVKSSYEGMRDALASVYGKPKTYDFLMPGSIWKDSNDWMMGLVKQDRMLQAEWKQPGMKNDLSSVTIDTRAQGRDKGYFVVEYIFSNRPACVAELQKKKNDSL